MFQKLLGWPVILGAMAIALVLGFVGYKERSEMSRLADHGKETLAQIEEVKWTTKRGVDRNFDLTIAFTTESGQAVKEKLRVDDATGKRARDDDAFVELPVRYLPEEPSVVRQADEADGSKGMFVIAAFALLAGVILLALRLRSAKG